MFRNYLAFLFGVVFFLCVTPWVSADSTWPDIQIQPDQSPGGDDPIYACACGCGVFDVGTASMLPQGPGGMAWLEYDLAVRTEVPRP